MTTKRYLTFIFLPLLAALAAAAIVVIAVQPWGEKSPLPAEAGTTSADVTLAAQKARLTLSDGRTATFAFACSGGTLTAHAAVGLDQECNYALLPLANPLPQIPSPDPTPSPAPTPTPGPSPTPNPVPSPQPSPQPQPSNLRVLFTYDPSALADLAPARQAILASPQLRSYLEKHCPLESNCASGMCPINAIHAAEQKGTVPFLLGQKLGQSPSYRFLAATADVAALPAVWQGIFNAARGKPAPWLLAVNEAGQTVVDQPWPESVDATLLLLKKFGGE